MNLWLVRHAAPQGAAGLCYGRTDLAADPAATAAAAHALAETLPPGVPVCASPSSRCHDLAQALRRLRGDLPVHIDSRLREMDFGCWEGRSWDDLGAAAIEPWVADFWHHRPGGGESVQAVFARVDAALADARAQSASSVWITHAGVIRTAGLLLQGIDRIEQACEWPRVPVAYGAWQVVRL